jgi:hypothetical protein
MPLRPWRGGWHDEKLKVWGESGMDVGGCHDV